MHKTKAYSQPAARHSRDMNPEYTISLLSNPGFVKLTLNDGFDFNYLSISALTFVIGFWIVRWAWQQVLFDRRPAVLTRLLPALPDLSEYQQEVLITWINQLVYGSIGCTVLFALGSPILVYGTFQQALYRDLPDTDIGHQPLWVHQAQRANSVWRWAFQPFVVLYLFEIVSASPARCRTLSHQLLTFHHLLVVLMASWIFKAFQTTFDPAWAQMGFALYLHMTLEQHSWLALILYRLRCRGHRYFLAASVAIEVAVRLVLWGLAFYVYSRLCFLACGVTWYAYVWRIVFPPLAALMIFAQVQIIRIHVVLTQSRFRAAQSGGEAGSTAKSALENDVASPTNLAFRSCSPRRTPSDAERGPEAESGKDSVEHSGQPFRDGALQSSTNAPSTGSSDDSSTTPVVSGASPLNVVLSSVAAGPDTSGSESRRLSSGAATSPKECAGQDIKKCDELHSNKPLHATASCNAGAGSEQRSTTAALWMHMPPLGLAVFTLVVFALIFGVDLIPQNAGFVENRCKRVAIVGGGASGIATAFALLRDGGHDFHVTIIERRDRLGGNAYSVSKPGKGYVNMGVQIIGETFRNAHNLMSTLGVDMFEGYGGARVLENRSGTLSTFSNFLQTDNPQVRKIDVDSEAQRFSDLLRVETPRWSEEKLMTTTLADFFSSHTFAADYVRSLVYSIHSYAPRMQNMPVGLFAFFDRVLGVSTHGAQRQKFLTVKGGLSQYISVAEQWMASTGRATVFKNSTPLAVQHSFFGNPRLQVQRSGGEPVWLEFDHVVFTSPKEETRKLLCDAVESSELPYGARRLYRSALGQHVTYNDIHVMAHDDMQLVRDRFQSVVDRDGCLRLELVNTFWDQTNNPTPIDELGAGFQSRPDPELNFWRECVPVNLSSQVRNDSYLLAFVEISNAEPFYPNPNLVIAQETFRHPVIDQHHYESGRTTHAIQGQHRLWFAGVDVGGVNLHEMAITSGLVIANEIGAAYPFDDDAEARRTFLALRGWMMHGFSPVVSNMNPPNGDKRRCERCP